MSESESTNPLVTVFPWAVHLPADDQVTFIRELAEHASNDEEWLLTEWKGTAEVWRDFPAEAAELGNREVEWLPDAEPIPRPE